MTINLDLLTTLIEDDKREVIPTAKDTLVQMLRQLRNGQDAERKLRVLTGATA